MVGSVNLRNAHMEFYLEFLHLQSDDTQEDEENGKNLYNSSSGPKSFTEDNLLLLSLAFLG